MPHATGRLVFDTAGRPLAAVCHGLAALRELGADVEIAAPWSDHTVVDGLLITGQNPLRRW